MEKQRLEAGEIQKIIQILESSATRIEDVYARVQRLLDSKRREERDLQAKLDQEEYRLR